MNNRFKFRAWDKRSNKMLKVIEIGFKFYDDESIGSITLDQETNDGYALLGNTENTILMQSTGLKDKNDTLIYEGDVVKANYITPSGKEIEEICTVKFDRCAYWIDYKYGASYLDNEDVIYEVIGNIYENKELLESEG